jgi:hypothetical protein
MPFKCNCGRDVPYAGLGKTSVCDGCSSGFISPNGVRYMLSMGGTSRWYQPDTQAKPAPPKAKKKWWQL